VQNRFLRGFTKADVRTLDGLLKRMLANADVLEESGIAR